MRRRGIGGVGAVQKQKEQQALFEQKSSRIQESQVQKLTEQMEMFRTNLEQFAAKHKKEIRKVS